MLHILLLILKIIGIIIAVILGLIIVLGLVILFVPIRYSIDADYHKKAVAHVKVTWLLHLLRGVVSYDEQLDISVKALWFDLYNNNDSDDEDLQTKSQKKKKSSKKEKLKEKAIKNKLIQQAESDPLTGIKNKKAIENTNCYKIMLLTGSKKKETLNFYGNAGYNSTDKTAFIQWLE